MQYLRGIPLWILSLATLFVRLLENLDKGMALSIWSIGKNTLAYEISIFSIVILYFLMDSRVILQVFLGICMDPNYSVNQKNHFYPFSLICQFNPAAHLSIEVTNNKSLIFSKFDTD